jgi:hypothetical protein
MNAVLAKPIPHDLVYSSRSAIWINHLLHRISCVRRDGCATICRCAA